MFHRQVRALVAALVLAAVAAPLGPAAAPVGASSTTIVTVSDPHHQYSRDRLVVSGSYDLGGTVQADKS